MRLFMLLFGLALLACLASAQSNNTCITGPFSDLKKAWNAAHNQIMLHGEYLSIFNFSAKAEGFLQPTGLCVPNSEAYPFPSPSSPVIARVIQSGKLLVASPGTFNTTTFPEEFPYVERILFYFNEHYGSDVTIEVVEFGTSDEALAGVQNEEADVAGPNFTPGVFVNNVSRTDLFAASCPDSAAIISVALSTELPVKTWTEFRDLYIVNTSATAEEKPKVSTLGFGSYLIAVGLLPGFNITLYDSFEDYIGAFNSGDADVLWDAGTSDFSVSDTGLGLTRPAQFALTDVVTTGASLFKYDEC